jgi:hypothetical protein
MRRLWAFQSGGPTSEKADEILMFVKVTEKEKRTKTYNDIDEENIFSFQHFCFHFFGVFLGNLQ